MSTDLAQHFEQVTRLEVLFDQFEKLCRRQLDSLERGDLDELVRMLGEKEALIAEIARCSAENAAAWESLPDTGDLEPLGELLGRIEGRIRAIQELEDELGRRLNERKARTQRAMGGLQRAEKAVNAYRPVRQFAPRFLDQRK